LRQLAIRGIEADGDFQCPFAEHAGGIFGTRGKQGGCLVGALRQLAIRGVEADSDFRSAREKGARGTLGLFAQLAIRIGQRLAGGVRQDRRQLQHLVAQLARRHDRALFENDADVFHAAGEGALHGAAALFNDAAVATEGFIDLGDVGIQGAGDVGATIGERLDMLRELHVDKCARLIELADIVREGLRQGGAPFRELVELTGDNAVDLGPAFRELGKVRVESAAQNIAPLRQLLDLPGDKSVDAGTAFGQLVEIDLQGRLPG
jgi:hypothetical protein